MLDVEFVELSDDGKSRDHNEDYLGHVVPASAQEGRSHGWLFALADGVGGHSHGEVASRTAVAKLQKGFRAAPVSEPLSALVARLAREANLEVYETSKKASSNMATTLVACALRHDRMAVAHAGDSRCYLIRNHQAALLTRDHTVANEHARLGILSAKEAAHSETKHVLVRSLGHDLFTTAEVNEHQLLVEDVLVLCSDGLHNSVEGSEIAAVAGGGGDLDHAARRLIELANDRDGSDNISVLIIRVRDVERVGMYRGRPYKLR